MSEPRLGAQVTFEDALRGIFEAYRSDVAEARKLMD